MDQTINKEIFNETFKQAFKEKLAKLLERDSLLTSEEKVSDYLDSLLYFIGDPDPELRDDLVYPVLGTFASSSTYLSDREAAALYETLLSDDYLHYGLGECHTDSVYKRAFSALIIAELLARHKESPFLTEDQLNYGAERSIDQFKREKDLRGFTGEKGWAHSNAHTADVFQQLLAIEPVNQQYLIPILEAISDKICQGAGIWTAEEDERLVTAVWRKFFTDPRITSEWVEAWTAKIVEAFGQTEGMERFYLSMNGKNFFRSLYFRGVYRYQESSVLKILDRAQTALNRHKDY